MGRSKAVEARGDGGGAEICVVCKRNPRKVPKDAVAQDRRGRVRPITPEEWAERVKVVAHGLCARDYQRQRRGSQPRDESARRGVGPRYTVRLTDEEDKLISKAVKKSNKSESAWCAGAMVAQAKVELGINE